MDYVAKFVSRMSDLIEKIGKWFVLTATVLMTMITTIEVFRRYFFGLSYKWSEELVRFLLVWVTFVGGSIMLKRGELVYLDLIQERFLSNYKEKVNKLLNILVIVFSSIVLYYSYKYTFSPSVVMQKSPGLNISMSYIYLSIPLGLLLIILFSVNNLLNNVGKVEKE